MKLVFTMKSVLSAAVLLLLGAASASVLDYTSSRNVKQVMMIKLCHSCDCEVWLHFFFFCLLCKRFSGTVG